MGYRSPWREIAARKVAQVLKDTEGMPEQEIRKALHEAYPFGVRRFHPYKIWLSEIKAQRSKDPLAAEKQRLRNEELLRSKLQDIGWRQQRDRQMTILEVIET